MQYSLRRVLATAVVAGGVVAAGGQAPASATTQWAEDAYYVCVDQACSMWVSGQITWGNRTALMTGNVVNDVPGGTATAAFDAFAGSTKVDSFRIIAHDDKNKSIALFEDLQVGDPTRVGGIDRIRVQICSSSKRCSVQWNEIRD